MKFRTKLKIKPDSIYKYKHTDGITYTLRIAGLCKICSEIDGARIWEGYNVDNGNYFHVEEERRLFPLE